MKLFPLIAGYAAANDCSAGQRLVNGVCTDKCDLFTVACDVKTGFTVSLDSTCKDAQYSHLTFDNDNFFVNANSLADGSDLDADAECKFNNGAISNLPFTSCGGFPFTEGATHNTHTGYINHRVKVGDTVTSFMDEIKFECNLEHVDLDTENEKNNAKVDLSANDEKTGTGEILSKELIEALGLGLKVGTTDTAGNYVADVSAAIDVGSTVQVKLQKADNPSFQFALRDCAAVSNSVTVELYETFCKNGASNVVNLKQKNTEAFNLNVFRIGNDDKLTFKCKVSLFPQDGDLPTCSDFSRKRRETTNVAFYERHARSASREGEVTFTVELNDGSSGAAKTCANIIIPSIFLYSLY